MMTVQRYLPAALVGILLGFFIFILIASQDFREAARIFPVTIAWAGIAVALLELARQVVSGFAREAEDFTDLSDEARDDPARHYRASGNILLWLMGFIVLVAVFGLIPAIVVFILGMLRFQFDVPWIPAITVTAGVIALTLVLTAVLVLRWPEPLIPVPGM